MHIIWPICTVQCLYSCKKVPLHWPWNKYKHGDIFELAKVCKLICGFGIQTTVVLYTVQNVHREKGAALHCTKCAQRQGGCSALSNFGGVLYTGHSINTNRKAHLIKPKIVYRQVDFYVLSRMYIQTRGLLCTLLRVYAYSRAPGHRPMFVFMQLGSSTLAIV